MMGSGYVVGDIVKCWYGERLGVITEVNRTMVKVRHIGGKQDNYATLEKHYMSDVIEMYGDPIPDLVGSQTKFLDWHGATEREGVILQQDGPFLLVGYEIKSGAARESWIDLGRLLPS
jgi:hypothetical protein